MARNKINAKKPSSESNKKSTNVEIFDDVNRDFTDEVEDSIPDDAPEYESFEPMDESVKEAIEEPKEKLVGIIPKVNHTFCYGGKWYCLKKDERILVPYEVKSTLIKAGFLLPS